MIRSARVEDAVAIHELIARYAKEEKMLSRSVEEICSNIEEYCVVEEEGQVVGCCALHVYSSEWAEVKAMAVLEAWQGRGYAREMVLDRLQRARDLGIRRGFCLTYVPELFAKLGFELIPKEALPHKIWAECIRCRHFSNCNEIALALSLDGKPLK